MRPPHKEAAPSALRGPTALKISGGCVLRYRVDTRRRKEFRMTIVMDAACSGAGAGTLRDAMNGTN